MLLYNENEFHVVSVIHKLDEKLQEFSLQLGPFFEVFKDQNASLVSQTCTFNHDLPLRLQSVKLQSVNDFDQNFAHVPDRVEVDQVGSISNSGLESSDLVNVLCSVRDRFCNCFELANVLRSVHNQKSILVPKTCRAKEKVKDLLNLLFTRKQVRASILECASYILEVWPDDLGLAILHCIEDSFVKKSFTIL